MSGGFFSLFNSDILNKDIRPKPPAGYRSVEEVYHFQTRSRGAWKEMRVLHGTKREKKKKKEKQPGGIL